MQEIITNQTLAPLSDVTVIKRGQTKTPFYGYKIGMVMRALGADEQLTKNVSWFLVNAFSDQATVTTAEIANAICAALNRAGRTDLATAFTEHRRQDDASFDKATDPQQKLNQLFDENSRVVHENANKDSKVFNTQRDLEAGVVSRALGLKMMPEVVAKAHLRGDIHWHDLDYSRSPRKPTAA